MRRDKSALEIIGDVVLGVAVSSAVVLYEAAQKGKALYFRASGIEYHWGCSDLTDISYVTKDY